MLHRIMLTCRKYWTHASIGMKTVYHILAGTTDQARWGSISAVAGDWQPRTHLLAEHIPCNAIVIEFGAGRQTLANHLPSGCQYIPSDFVSHTPSTFVCDLNATRLPSFPVADVPVLSGVLEYVHDVPRLAQHLADHTRMVLCSYSGLDDFPSLIRRRANGWVNDLSSNTIVQVFADVGFLCEYLGKWEGQQLYRFFREDH